MPSLTQFAFVGLGGAVGAMLRYFVESLGIFDADKYLYTLVVNITGCLSIGVAYAVITNLGFRHWTYELIITGIIGGYTTYSSFSLDFTMLVKDGRATEAMMYLLTTVVCTLAGCLSGYYLTNKLFKILG